MTFQNHLMFWFLALGFLTGFLWLFQDILLPFIVGLALAYFLNPAVDFLVRLGFNRSLAVLSILFVFLLFLLGIVMTAAPILYRELGVLGKDLPLYMDIILSKIEPWSLKAQAYLGQTDKIDIKTLIGDYGVPVAGVGNKVVSGVISGGSALIGFLSFLFLMPVVAFFLMKEWPRIVNYVESLLPRAQEKTVKTLFKEMNQKLSAFVRGQLSVAFILATGYGIALSLAGLKYGFLIGFSAGILSIIPMLGSIVGFVVGVGVAWFQTGEWGFVLLIAGIFLGGQVLEGNILTPKLVGGSVGLHPLWVFFALLAGGSLLGLLGMLIAVPLAAMAGVLAAFAIQKYKDSAYYRGNRKKAPRKNA